MGGPKGEHHEGLDALLGEVGQRLAKLRRQRNLRQRELAVRIPMSVAQVKHLEQGRTNVTLGTLLRVADFFDVPVRKLLTPLRLKPER